MVKILKVKEREEKEGIYDELDDIDSTFLDINYKLRLLKREFKMKRDQNLIERITARIEWCANKTLLLKGRITSFELGAGLFMDKDYLQFHFRRKAVTPRNLKYVPLKETKYSGKRFSKFMKRELGAKAHVGIEGDKMIILSILIPRDKKSLIIYK